MKHRNRLFLSGLLLAVTLASCNTDDTTVTPDPNPAPATNCRIISGQSVRGTVTTPITFTYNDDKKLTSFQEGDGSTDKKTYTNYSGFIVGVQIDNGTATHRDSIFLNSAGYVTRFVNVKLPADTVTSMTVYTYDANGQLTTATSTELGFAPVTSTIEYNSAGDLTKVTQSNGSVGSYGYHTDKAVRPGDLFGVQALTVLGSGKIFKTAHLVKSETITGGGSTSTTNYAYEFDGSDRITKLTITPSSGSPTVITLQQTCD